jgi:serine/threonine protein kinase
MSNQPSQPQSSSSKSVSSSKTTITDFNIHRLLGEGSYGKVLYAQSKKTNKEYAIKSIDKFFLSKLNKVHEAFIEREMLSSTLSHPNITKLITSFQSKDKLYYVLPYYKNGSLQDLIAKNGTLPYAQAQFYLAQIVNVLEYFESKHIAHLDMKPHNILIDDDNNIKVIDFATATKIGCEYDMKRKMFVSRRNKCVDMVGTVEYASPEMISGNVVNEKSCDLWALGVNNISTYHFR